MNHHIIWGVVSLIIDHALPSRFAYNEHLLLEEIPIRKKKHKKFLFISIDFINQVRKDIIDCFLKNPLFVLENIADIKEGRGFIEGPN